MKKALLLILAVLALATSVMAQEYILAVPAGEPMTSEDCVLALPVGHEIAMAPGVTLQPAIMLQTEEPTIPGDWQSFLRIVTPDYWGWGWFSRFETGETKLVAHADWQILSVGDFHGLFVLKAPIDLTRADFGVGGAVKGKSALMASLLLEQYNDLKSLGGMIAWCQKFNGL